MRALPQVEFSLVLSIMVHIALIYMRYFTQIALTVVLLWCFAGLSQDFGGSDAMATAKVRLVGFVSRIVARMVAHRYA